MRDILFFLCGCTLYFSSDVKAQEPYFKVKELKGFYTNLYGGTTGYDLKKISDWGNTLHPAIEIGGGSFIPAGINMQFYTYGWLFGINVGDEFRTGRHPVAINQFYLEAKGGRKIFTIKRFFLLGSAGFGLHNMGINLKGNPPDELKNPYIKDKYAGLDRRAFSFSPEITANYLWKIIGEDGLLFSVSGGFHYDVAGSRWSYNDSREPRAKGVPYSQYKTTLIPGVSSPAFFFTAGLTYFLNLSD